MTMAAEDVVKSDDVTVEVEQGVQIIRISRPDKKNALTYEMYGAMISALNAGDASDDVAVHLITGCDDMFTAGNDLAEFLAVATGQAGSLVAADFLKAIVLVKKPLIAAVNGPAIGIGATMLLHCDLAYASPNAEFSTPFVNLGAVPEGGSSLLAPRLMGHARAFELLCLGKTFDAEKALSSGLVNEIVPKDELVDYAIQVGRLLASKPPEALALSRKMMQSDRDEVLKRIEDELKIFTERLVSDEAREAFTAFFEKRPPNFSRNS